MRTRNLKEKEIKAILKKVKILIITATDPEKKALRNALKPLPNQKEILKIAGMKTVYYVGTFGAYPIAHIHCNNQGSVGIGGSILTVAEALNEIKDIKMCIMVGIAFGADSEKQKIGDVLVSSSVQTYESVRISTDEDGNLRIDDRNKLLTPGGIIRNQFLSFDYDNRSYNIHHGIFLCGEKLVDNLDYKQELLKKFKVIIKQKTDIVGGEMESAGLAYSMASIDNLNWMIVKGISDFGDGNKKCDKTIRQKIASENAVEFCKNIFETEMLTNIQGIKTLKPTTEYKVKTEMPLDPFAMFYYRNKKMVSFIKLSQITGIPEDELREYELFENEQNRVKMINKDNIEAICNVLDCNLAYEDRNGVMANFYHAYKGKKRFYPVNDAKVVVFDFDGTLTHVKNNRTSWELIWLYLGYTLNDCGSLYRQFMNKEFDHQEWCDRTARFFSQKNLKSSDMEKIAQNIRLVDGTIETLRFLKGKGIKLYICSGAMDDLIDTIFKIDERNLFEKIECNRFSYDRNGYLKSIQGTQFDFEGKANFIRKIIDENEIQPEECIFVGNSDNDIWAHESGAKTLVVNPHKINGMNRTEWKYYLEKMDNLKEIIPFIFPYNIIEEQ